MVKMVLGSSDKQGSTMSSVAQARVAAYNQAISALTNFNGTGELTGAAYDSGKNYGMSTIIPLIKGALMYAESLGEAVPKLPSKYRAEVGGEDLDSAELERDIRGLESSLAGLRGVYRAMEKNDDVSPSSLQSISARMDDLTSEKNKKMEQLRKLNLFAGSSNAVFGGEDGIKSIDGLLGNIVTGINQVQTEFANFGGTFPSHSNDMEWAKNIEGEWTKKAEIDKNYQKVLKKLDDGKKLDEKDIKAIQAYQSRYPARDLPENVKKELKSIRNLKLSKKPLKAKIAKAEGINLDKFVSNLFGYEIRAGKGHTFTSEKYDFYTTYEKFSNHVVFSKKGLITFKLENMFPSGIALDLNSARLDFSISDGHVIATSNGKLPNGNQITSRYDVGFNPDRWFLPEINIAYGFGNDRKINELGGKVSLNIIDGILGFYGRETNISPIDKGVKNIEIKEMGFQFIDAPKIAIAALVVLSIFRPDAQTFANKAIEWLQKLGTA